MGCGAHLIELRRTRVGPFSVDESVSVPGLEEMTGKNLENLLIPLEDALERVGLPKIVIKNESERLVRNGSPVRKDFVDSAPRKLKEGDDVGIFNHGSEIVCLAKFVGKSDITAKTERVFLE